MLEILIWEGACHRADGGANQGLHRPGCQGLSLLDADHQEIPANSSADAMAAGPHEIHQPFALPEARFHSADGARMSGKCAGEAAGAAGGGHGVNRDLTSGPVQADHGRRQHGVSGGPSSRTHPLCGLFARCAMMDACGHRLRVAWMVSLLTEASLRSQKSPSTSEVTPSKIIQLVRERPPGYGGVERVAHEMANEWCRQGFSVRTVCLQPPAEESTAFLLPVSYELVSLPRLSLGQFLCPLPSRRLFNVLNESATLHVHLPCPALLLLSILARLRRPQRIIRLHWHAFLEPPVGPTGWLIGLYQRIALLWAAVGVQSVITTSPVLAGVLQSEGVPRKRVLVLPCCLGEGQERMALQTAHAKRPEMLVRLRPLRLLFIGRLDSYKRVDWLIDAIAHIRDVRLDVVGDGPQRKVLQRLAASSGCAGVIRFHGRLEEEKKQELLSQSHLLVLPADRSNEALGIVQLEAMAYGVPALALDCRRSGAAWVGQLKHVIGLPRLGRKELPEAIHRLIEDPWMLHHASKAAERRYKRIFARSIWQARFAELLP